MANRRVVFAAVFSFILIAIAIAYGVETGLIEPDYVVVREPGGGGTGG